MKKINTKELQFINDVLKPWDELNKLLALPYAFEPGINDVVRMATNLAIAINHWCETENENKKTIIASSDAYRIMVDVANMVKHKSLHKKNRENTVYAVATFEFLENEETIKFLRTVAFVEYTNGDKYDFIIEAAKAINFWINHSKLNISKERIVLTHDNKYQKEIVLYYNPSKCVRMSSTRIQVYKKDENNNLVPCSPKNVKIGVAEMQN